MLFQSNVSRALNHDEQAIRLYDLGEHASFAHGEFDRRRERQEELLTLCEQLGFPVYLAAGRFWRGFARVESGKGEAGLTKMQQAIVELAEIGNQLAAPMFLSMLAEGLRKVGRHDETLRALGLGVAQAEQQGQHICDAEIYRLRAEILLDRDGNAVEEAQALSGPSLEIVRRQEAKTFELRATASDLLAPVCAWFTEGIDTRDLIAAQALLDELT